MSIIPKISVGLPKKREKRNLNYDCSTTSNIGSVQPTMCREMVPNEKYSVKVSSLVRLASMPLPTFGRMSLRHYHVFIPYSDIWQPFQDMLAGRRYFSEGSQNFVPSTVPYFKPNEIFLHYIMMYSDVTFFPRNDLDHPLVVDLAYITDPDTGQQVPDIERMNEQLLAVQNAYNNTRTVAWFGGALSAASHDQLFGEGAGSFADDSYGMINAGDFCGAVNGAQAGDKTFTLHTPSQQGNFEYAPGNTPISWEGADLITEVGNYMVAFKFKAPLKRFRTIFIGLGYQFSPYNLEEMSVLKVLAYYKAWFSLFCPDREKSFVDTKCYELLKYISGRDGINVATVHTACFAFFDELFHDCYYYLPMDYYSMAVKKPQESTQAVATELHTFTDKAASSTQATMPTPTTADRSTAYGYQNNGTGTPNVDYGTLNSPLLLRMAQRLLVFANKNTVIGRNIRDYLKVHYGVEATDTIDNGDVIRIGASRVNINITDIMSTSENSEGYLGEYGGKGIGYGDSDTFSFTAKEFGVWITLTTIVPESGYYQGYLRENRHLTRYDFFAPEFDALGYQVLERGEIMDDYNCDSQAWNPYLRATYNRKGAFGFVPRYSEYKVGRNIVNGDLSLVGLANSMSPYTVDRRISAGSVATLGYSAGGDYAYRTITTPSFVPSVVYDNFRRIDPTDHLGQYNRIFNVVSNDVDHFIIHNIFEVKATAPMKSLTTSFDTYGEEDDTSINVAKA